VHAAISGPQLTNRGAGHKTFSAKYLLFSSGPVALCQTPDTWGSTAGRVGGQEIYRKFRRLRVVGVLFDSIALSCAEPNRGAGAPGQARRTFHYK